MHLHKLGHVSKISDQSHLGSIGAKREANRIGSVVWNLKSVDIDIADSEVLAGLNSFHTAQTLPKPIGQGTVQRLHSLLGNEQRRFPKAKHLRQAVAVVAMFVGDENAVYAVDAKFDGSETGERFAFAEAAIHEESGALCLEQGDVARAA